MRQLAFWPKYKVSIFGESARENGHFFLHGVPEISVVTLLFGSPEHCFASAASCVDRLAASISLLAFLFGRPTRLFDDLADISCRLARLADRRARLVRCVAELPESRADMISWLTLVSGWSASLSCVPTDWICRLANLMRDVADIACCPADLIDCSTKLRCSLVIVVDGRTRSFDVLTGLFHRLAIFPNCPAIMVGRLATGMVGLSGLTSCRLLSLSPFSPFSASASQDALRVLRPAARRATAPLTASCRVSGAMLAPFGHSIDSPSSRNRVKYLWSASREKSGPRPCMDETPGAHRPDPPRERLPSKVHVPISP